MGNLQLYRNMITLQNQRYFIAIEMTSLSFQQIKAYLDRMVCQINRVEFITNDPVQFVRRFERQQDIEIASLLCSTIAWGKRSMICKNCDKMLSIMYNEPYDYVREGEFERLDDRTNIHRTFFSEDLKYYLRGLRRVYSQYATLEEFAEHHQIARSETPAWELVRYLVRELNKANQGRANSRCLPTNLEGTALKRINMALRWLVRNDGIVDMGVWTVLKPSQLFIPLDVHVGNTARGLGLIERRANDRKTVLMLTDVLRQMRPNDPVVYDFALFGIGVGEIAVDSLL